MLSIQNTYSGSTYLVSFGLLHSLLQFNNLLLEQLPVCGTLDKVVMMLQQTEE